MNAPPKAPPPPAKSAPPPSRPAQANQAPTTQSGGVRFGFSEIVSQKAQRIAIYGTGGIGKSSLACLAARKLGNVGYIDLEATLPNLKPNLQKWGVVQQVKPIRGVTDWDDLLECLAAPIWDDIGCLVIDTLTRVEEMALSWTLRNVKHEKGHTINRIEDYGFGKGYQHLYETFLSLFSHLDVHFTAGRSVILLCHEITSTVPNPTGEDYLRWEPRLQHPSSQKSSVRLKCKEWCDHLLYLGYDLFVDNNGVARGSGTRTIQVSEQPWCMAKSRTLRKPIVFAEGDSQLWDSLFPVS